MLRELVDVSAWLRGQGKLGQVGYSGRNIKHIIDLDSSGGFQVISLTGKNEGRSGPVPARQRSGTPRAKTNEKPLLLADEKSYTLGIADSGDDREARLVHGFYVDLIQRAYDSTRDPDVGRVRDFLGLLESLKANNKPLPESLSRDRFGAKELITFRCDGTRYPIENPVVARFWAEHLSQEVLSGTIATCSTCGKTRDLIKTMPVEVVIMGQPCQITSFNLSAFESLGKKQMANAPLCFDCAMGATQALQYFTGSKQHSVEVARASTKGVKDPLRDQLAVFWLRVPPEADGQDEFVADFGPLQSEVGLPMTISPGVPPPELAQLASLLHAPKSSRTASLFIDQTSFCLAVLSANKRRMVVREWLTISLGRLHQSIATYFDALSVVDPDGVESRVFPIPAMLEELKATDRDSVSPHFARALLRTAYQGVSPPEALLAPAVARFEASLRPKKRDDKLERYLTRPHKLIALMKLVLAHNAPEARSMNKLDPGYQSRAYQCGRLLAVLEEAQRRASAGRLNATLVDRYYGGASSAPATTLLSLLRLAQMAHLPKIRRNARGADALERTIEEISVIVRDQGGYPATLTLRDQAEFALGFYCQRAQFRADHPANRGTNPTPEQAGASSQPAQAQ